MAGRLLNLSKTIDKRIWGFETPLRQFSILSPEIINKLEAGKMKIERLREMDAKEIGMYIYICVLVLKSCFVKAIGNEY
ncbi:hypothetical protein DPMN_053047 [Dreissena polymorpha]|uniref:Uncharacterized protein n=1 Tax=Dreissena polymorpha TaxID=45954 RepID=A0A9D4HNH3_DREPO|nr:hypothetical protein DPMN_053047 [Dreissena polymorpha]